MSEKEPKTAWTDCEQVFFTGGKGWGLTDRLQTICLGKEEDIRKFLATGELNPDLRPMQRQVLLEIQNYRKEEGFGTSGLGKGSMERGGLNGGIRTKQVAARQSTAKKRLPLRSTRSKVKSISRK